MLQEISAQLKIRGFEGLQRNETATSKDSSNVKPNNDKKKQSTPLKKKFQIEEKKTTVREELPVSKYISFVTANKSFKK